MDDERGLLCCSLARRAGGGSSVAATAEVDLDAERAHVVLHVTHHTISIPVTNNIYKEDNR